LLAAAFVLGASRASLAVGIPFAAA